MIGKLIQASSPLVRRLIRVATRVLPFSGFTNRLIVSQFAESGDNVHFYGKPRLTGVDKIVAGTNVHIGSGSFIRAEGGLSIGDNCHISRNVLIYTVNHDHDGELLPYDSNMSRREVTIGKNVWIGMNVCVVPGARIGDGAIIGMGSVVAGEVPKLAIMGSPPLRVLGYRDADRYELLDGQGVYGGKDGQPYVGPVASRSAEE